MAPLNHRLLVRVPRLVEREPGHMDDQALTPDGDSVWSIGALYEPLSRRWMGRPSAVVAGDYEWSGAAFESAPFGGRTGVRVTAAGDWEIVGVPPINSPTTDYTGAGFYVDWMAYEDTEAFTIEWGDVEGQEGQHHWRLRIEDRRLDTGLCTVSEYDGAEWHERAHVALLGDTPTEQPHRIWFQPLHDDEWLLRNAYDPLLGAVITARYPYAYDSGAVESAEDTAPRIAFAPWGNGRLTVRGNGPLWFARLVLTYSYFYIGTRSPRAFGYSCTQPYTAHLSAWVPDGRTQSTVDIPGVTSDYTVTLAVLQGPPVETHEEAPAGQPAPWLPSEDGLPEYGWLIRATAAPENYRAAYRTPVVDRLMLRWPRTLADDGATEVDLIGHEEVTVLGLVEDRSYRDEESTLTVQLHGPADLLDHITMPAQRWQWRLVDDDGSGWPSEYIRFDGLRDTAPMSRYTLIDGTWTADTTVTIRTRWRQAAAVMYRGQTIIDGLPRTEAYRALAALIPLDETEVVVPVPLPDDGPLPMAKRGQPPLWSAEVGQALGSLIRDLADVAGPRDRLLFRDWDGVAALVVDQPSGEPVARFYRTQAAADAAGVPAQCLRSYDKRQGMVIGWDDSEFFNEIVVVGTAPADVIYDLASGPEREIKRGAPIVRYFAAPESWQIAEIDGAVNRRYVGCRRAVVYDDPQLNTPLAVERRLRGLVEQFYRFRSGGQVSAGLVPDLYPGDVIVIDPGDEDGAADAVYEVRGMRTEVLSLHAADRGIVTLYELGEVPG